METEEEEMLALVIKEADLSGYYSLGLAPPAEKVIKAIITAYNMGRKVGCNG